MALWVLKIWAQSLHPAMYGFSKSRGMEMARYSIPITFQLDTLYALKSLDIGLELLFSTYPLISSRVMCNLQKTK